MTTDMEKGGRVTTPTAPHMGACSLAHGYTVPESLPQQRSGKMLKRYLELVLENNDARSLSTAEKLVLVALLVEWDGNEDLKVDVNYAALARVVGLSVDQARLCLLALEGSTWLAWSGGTKANGSEVYYLDGVRLRGAGR